MATSKTYTTLRAVSATDDTGLAANGAYYSLISTLLVPAWTDQAGTAHIIFKGTNANAENGNWNLFAVKGVGAPAEFVAHGTFDLGLTLFDATVTNLYADTIVITHQSWNKTVYVVPGYQYNLGTGAVATAGIAKLCFDTCEYQYLLMLMSKGTVATGGAEIANFY